MAKTFPHIDKNHRSFIENQKIFFVATSPKKGRINLSPKGMDSFRITDKNSVVWLNYTGSGNETAAHVLEDPRMTIMFCSFEKKPQILRLYGKAECIYPNHEHWQELISLFDDHLGARQIFTMDVELVKTSCGESVPFYQYTGERHGLKNWLAKKWHSGIREYWQSKNKLSMDGKTTGLPD